MHSPLRIPSDYRSWWWFYDRLRLFDCMCFSYHVCDHEPLPTTKEEREGFDYYFIKQARLEAKGWRSVSINHYSRWERNQILDWAKARPKSVYIADETKVEGEIYAVIGLTNTKCFGLTMEPHLLEEFKDFAFGLSALRPCMAIFEGCKKLPLGVRSRLRGKNHDIQVGEYGIGVSFEIISDKARKAIYELVAQHSKRDLTPKDWVHVYAPTSTSSATTFKITTGFGYV